MPYCANFVISLLNFVSAVRKFFERGAQILWANSIFFLGKCANFVKASFKKCWTCEPIFSAIRSQTSCNASTKFSDVYNKFAQCAQLTKFSSGLPKFVQCAHNFGRKKGKILLNLQNYAKFPSFFCNFGKHLGELLIH